MRADRPLVSLVLVLAVVLAEPARATISPSAQAIVDRYVTATGGAAALAADTVRYVRGRLNTMDLRGTQERWAQAPDRFRTRISLGTLRIIEGADSSAGWRTDLESRHVTPIEGDDFDRMRGEAYFENEMWARPGQGGGTVAKGSASFRDDGEWMSLEVTPPHGQPRTLWFQESDSLLARFAVHYHGGDAVHSLQGYRWMAGRRRPRVELAGDKDWRFTWDPHDAQDQEQFTVDSMTAHPRMPANGFAPPASHDRAVAWGRTPGLARVPFRFGSQHVWLKVSINGLPPADFILDTGVTTTTLDAEYAEEIGLAHEGRMAVQGMGGGDDGSFSQVRSLTILGEGGGDGVTLHDVKIGLLSVADGEMPFLWRRMCGLIGYDVLSRFVVTIDYDHQLVTLRDPNHYAYAGAGQAFDMKLTMGVPLVHAVLDSALAGDFLVDVGNAFGLVVHGSMVRRCHLLDATAQRKQLELYGGGVGSGFVSWMTRLDSLAIGRYVIPRPIAGLSLSTHGLVGSEAIAGNIGSSVLRRFVCTFDYAHHTLYLEPGEHFADPERWSRCGTMFAGLYDKVVAVGILHGSAADRAGLQPEDEVTTIDGRPVMTYTPEEMDRMFVQGAPGATHRLAILRNGQAKTITLTLADAL